MKPCSQKPVVYSFFSPLMKKVDAEAFEEAESSFILLPAEVCATTRLKNIETLEIWSPSQFITVPLKDYGSGFEAACSCFERLNNSSIVYDDDVLIQFHTLICTLQRLEPVLLRAGLFEPCRYFSLVAHHGEHRMYV